MATDLTYKPANGANTLTLTGNSDIPEVLKKAITLMLFSEEPDIRNFNGTSVVNSFPTLSQAGFDGISFYLTLAAAKIHEILASEYSDISDVYFEANDSPSELSVTLNVVMNGSTESVVVYE